MKKRYWLNGAIIGLFLPLIPFCLKLLDSVWLHPESIPFGKSIGLVLLIIFFVFWFPSMFIFTFLVERPLHLFGLTEVLRILRRCDLGCSPTFLGWGVLLVLTPLVFAFLGWLYGKIKNRKSNLSTINY